MCYLCLILLYQAYIKQEIAIRSNNETAIAGIRKIEFARAEAQRQEQQRHEQERLANLYRQAGNNFGNLPNTSRMWSHSADRRVYTIYNFGNGNYIRESVGIGGLPSTATGTFRVNGDTVIFLSSESEYSFGTIIGSTIIVVGHLFSGGDMVFR